MNTKVFDDTFILIGILSEYILDDNYDFFDHILRGHFLSNQFMKRHHASFGGTFELYGNSSDCRYSFSGEYDINLLSIVFELVKQLVDVFKIRESHHELKLC